MKTIEVVRCLDAVRGKIRAVDPELKGKIKKDHVAVSTLAALLEALNNETESTLAEPKSSDIVIDDEMLDLFATLPEEKTYTAVELGNRAAPKGPAKKQPEMKAVMLPRETPHINHPPVLEDADESTVVK